MKTKFFALFVLVGLIVGLGMGTAFSATVGIRSPDGSSEIWVQPSTVFEVELYLSLSPAEMVVIADNGITGYTIDIIWDPLVGLRDWEKGDLYTVVDVVDAETGSSPAKNEENDWVGSKLELSGFAMLDAITTTHVMETLTLHCLRFGDTQLVPEGHFDVPENFGLADYTNYLEDLLAVEGYSLDYQAITIHQTPIPSAVLLLGSGFLGLIGIGRRRMRKSLL